MASTSSAYGVQPISDQTGFGRPARMTFGIASGLASNIFKYQPIKINTATGTIVPVAANTDRIFGIFAGVEYTPLGGRPVESPFWPANTAYDSTYDMLVYYWPAWVPGTRWQIQADGSVAQGLMGSGFSLTNITAGSTSTGLSACTVGAAGVAGGTQAQFAFVEFFEGVNDPPNGGDAYTDLICTIAYPQVGFAGQTSIG